MSGPRRTGCDAGHGADLPPMVASLPFKLIFFVLIGGGVTGTDSR
jgi:hypothetical protein